MPRDIINKILITSLPIIAIYCLWTIASFLFLVLGLLFFQGGSAYKITSPFTVILFIALASLSTAIFLRYVDGHLRSYPILRYLFVLLTIIIGFGIFASVRYKGVSNNFLFILGTANLLVFANLIGTWIIAPLKRPAELIPVCLVMALSDFFSIIAGPTGEIAKSIGDYYEGGMKGIVPAGDFLLFKIPVPGVDIIMPFFGVADWIIISFLSAAVTKFGMNDNLFGKSLGAMLGNAGISVYFPVAALGLAAAVLSAQVAAVFIPALPVIAFVFLSYIIIRYPQVRMLKRSDWVLMVLFSTLMLFMLAVCRNGGGF